MTWKDILLIIAIAGIIAMVVIFVYIWWERKHRVTVSTQVAKDYAAKWVQDSLEKEQKLDADEMQNKLREKYGKKDEK